MRIFIISTGLVTSLVHAHAPSSAHVSTEITAAAAFTWRSGESLSRDEYWLPEGFLLGGEAMPYEKGATLDDFQLLASKNLNDAYFVRGKLSGHNHSGENTLEVENLWLGKSWQRQNQIWLIEVGKMATEVTETANFHSSDDDFSQAHLLSDFFFGRHFDDTGLRVTWQQGDSTVGIEVFSGENYPASRGEYSQSIYFKKNTYLLGAQLDLGLFAMISQAERRADERYSAHNHNNAEQQPDQVFFTGDSKIWGSYVALYYQINHWQFGLGGEMILLDNSGQVNQTTQSANIDSEQTGIRLTGKLGYHAHEVLFDYQKVAIENKFSKTSSSFLTSANLFNQGFEPERVRMSWLYHLNEHILLRSEWSREALTAAMAKQNHIGFGLRWRYTLYSAH
ncbi:hypothetical protein [Gayadomonas joobiniege]|uniref:hypothetical protein n=1 Tax=Gayadomonas joobiniege TaxID=1234606 RepID=UPI00036D7CD5|nr:hypothetical protein [Gayadomonas joobiniege]